MTRFAKINRKCWSGIGKLEIDFWKCNTPENGSFAGDTSPKHGLNAMRIDGNEFGDKELKGIREKKNLYEEKPYN